MSALITDAYHRNKQANSAVRMRPFNSLYTKWEILGMGLHKSHEKKMELFDEHDDSPKGETERVSELELEIAKLKQYRDRKDRNPIRRTGYVLISECQRVLG
jgi:hypothetical protein